MRRLGEDGGLYRMRWSMKLSLMTEGKKRQTRKGIKLGNGWSERVCFPGG